MQIVSITRGVATAALILIIFSLPGISQVTPASKDAQALQVIEKSVAAMSAAPITQLHSWTITGISNRINVGGNASAQSFTWLFADGEFRAETVYAGHRHIFLSGHGQPARIVDEKISKLYGHIASAHQPFYMPVYLLNSELTSGTYSVKYIGETVQNGVTALHIRTSDESSDVDSVVTTQDWYFDANTYLPLRVEFRLPSNNNALKYQRGAFDFSRFTKAGDFLVPDRIVSYQDEVATKQVSIESIALNSSPASSSFDAPEGDAQ